jgi:hypothetical protein
MCVCVKLRQQVKLSAEWKLEGSLVYKQQVHAYESLQKVDFQVSTVTPTHRMKSVRRFLITSNSNQQTLMWPLASQKILIKDRKKMPTTKKT